MTVLGTLFRNRRARDSQSAWNFANLQGPPLLTVTSSGIEEGGVIALEHTRKRIGGKNLSPDLTWSPPPPETTELLLVVEDLDGPIATPAVHCLVLIDPSQLDSPQHLPPGALSAREPARGVRILRSTISRGYQGPDPLKGHGPHRYSFQFFALAGEPISTLGESKIDRARPRTLLASINVPVVSRGRLTGIYER